VLLAHEDLWAPVAAQLAHWTDLAKQAQEKEPLTRLVQSAAEFMKETLSRLRNRALTRLKDEARDIWAALRQESNVELGAIELKSTGTRRRVELRADVDGAEAQALGVMSQGELHALALALFLPRATMKGSPFRFILLDDPIQAMDPAKIDGFVQVLTELAKERQVIVLSHDDRLPQAVRQMRVDARILEVCRNAHSALQVTPCSDPARRFLDDAFAVAKDSHVPDDVRMRVIPGLCRMAVEAAARDVYMARRFTAGDTRVDVEAAWQETTTTRQRLALAVHGEKAADLSAWLNAKPARRSGHMVVTKGAHEGIRREPMHAVRDVERIVEDLRAGGR
jgi:ABC-type lipoprotein export system ATPase subunit